MTALALTITDAGRAAIVNAQNTGTAPIVISQIALGSGTYNPTDAPGAARTALAAEIKRITTFGADVVADDTLHVTITDTSADTYDLGEVGLYTNTGVLFAFYAHTTHILEKGAQQFVLLSADILLTSVPPGSVTIGDTDFMLPPATTTRQGIIELATDAEVDAGTDTARAVTPKGMALAILSAFPVGAVYITTTNNNPSTFLGGTWAQIAQGRTLMGVGTLGSDTYSAGSTGGAARVTLTTAEMPAHNHGGETGTQSANHTHSGTTASAGAHTHSLSIPLNSAGSTPSLENGGPSTTSYTTSEDGSHTHTFTTGINSGSHTHNIPSQGGSGAHENRPPYLVVYFWQRTQ